MVQDAGAAAVTIHGRTAAQSYSGHADWSLVSRVADDLDIPVIGSGDCTEPEHVVERMVSGVDGVLVGRGVLRNPWILAQAHDLLHGARAARRHARDARAGSCSSTSTCCWATSTHEAPGFRHQAPTTGDGVATNRPAQGREKWVINKIRALNAWYSKGYEGGAHFRIAINQCHSIAELRDLDPRVLLRRQHATVA